MCVCGHHEAGVKGTKRRTIYSLEATARGHIKIVAIWTEQLDCVKSRDI